MSVSASLSMVRPAGLAWSDLRRPRAPAGSSAALLIRAGGLGAVGSVLLALALFRLGLLTLIWAKLLPVAGCAGLAAFFLGLLLLCLRALRQTPATAVLRTSDRNRL